MRIGELAATAAVSTKTIRYYESIGLLREPERTASGYRDYGPGRVERLRFIRDAQATGLTLAEIQSVLELKDAGAASCDHTRSLARATPRRARRPDRHVSEIARAELLRPGSDRAGALDPSACTDPNRCQVIDGHRLTFLSAGRFITGGMTTTRNTSPRLERADLAIEGMTCAGVRTPIEEGLGGLDGVADALVNFATGAAPLSATSPSRRPRRLPGDGRGARLSRARWRAITTRPSARREVDLWHRFVVAAALAVPVMVISMIHPLRFDGWEWVAAALATPVVFWAGWRFHRVAVRNLAHGCDDHGHAGVGGHARRRGPGRPSCSWSPMSTMATSTSRPAASSSRSSSWASGSRSGRPAARATRSGRSPISAPAPPVSRTAARSPSTTWPWACDSWSGPASEIATDGVVVSGRRRSTPPMITGESVPVEVAEGDEVIGASINTNGSLAGRGDPGRGRHGAGPDHPPRRPGTGQRAEVQRLADRVASVFVPAVWSSRPCHPGRLARLSDTRPTRRSPPPSPC